MRSKGKYIWMVLFVAFVGGYLLLDTSGLLGTQVITTGTTIGTVNGAPITYGVWQNRANELATEREQGGRSVDLDERAQLENQAFDELVMDIILRGEYARRSIRVTDQEIRDAARYAPPPAFAQSAELQTDGQFDRAKWERFLANPAVRQQGLLGQLERYYRDGLPKEKFYSQLAGDVYLSDAQLWRSFQDAHDTADVSYVAFRPAPGADSAARAQVTDADVNAYYQTYRNKLSTPTRAIVTALIVSRRPSAGDSAVAHARLIAARDRIAKGEKFETVAKEVSDDTVSGKDGGKLPEMQKDAYVKEFSDAAIKLRPGQISDPVRTPFGWHLIRLNSRKGDTISVHHILVAIRQSDSNATKTDRLADSLAKLAAGSEVGSKLDSAAARFGLTRINVDVVEGQRAMAPDGTILPGLSQWATGGTGRVGEISDLFDSDTAYFVARLDSLIPGGEAALSKVKEDIRLYLARRKAVQGRMKDAQAFASAAARVGFDVAAKQSNFKVETTGPATRLGFVPSLGGGSPVVGAAFGLATGAVSEPVTADDGLYVIRVDRRKDADREAWQKQMATQRMQAEQQAQQDRVRQYLASLRDEAKVVDKRKEVFAAARRTTN